MNQDRIGVMRIFLVMGALAVGWYLYKKWRLPETSAFCNRVAELEMAAREAKLAAASTTPSVQLIERLVSSSECWSGLQSKIKNTVVQVFVQKAVVDILQPYKSPTQGEVLGSGFFISEDEIVTNAHVVEQSKSIYIHIPGLGREPIDVELVGLSPDRDLALLRLLPEGKKKIVATLGQVSYLPLGDSDLVFRTDEIITIGYPLGQQGIKSTKGIVSGREQNMLQIDAAINPGNSGGPSLNLKGEVIGVNTAGIFAGGTQNVGYIMPINELKIILNDLRAVKLLKKPFLGILFNSGSEALTKFLGNPVPGGLYVVQTYAGSPMARAGIVPGDMIYAIDDYPVDIYGEIPWGDEKISIIDYVCRLQLGHTVRLVVYRHGERKEIEPVFEQTEMLPIKRIYPGYDKIDYEVIAGMLIQPLTSNHLPLLVTVAPTLTKYAEIKFQAEPALICTHIFPDSLAHRGRSLMPGMVISSINGMPVKTLDDLRQALFKGIESSFLTIETTDGVFAAFPFDKVVADDQRLARDYFYPLTPGVQAIVNAQNKGQKKQEGFVLGEDKKAIGPIGTGLPS